jgi:hypothetical protein
MYQCVKSYIVVDLLGESVSRWIKTDYSELNYSFLISFAGFL